MPYSAALCRGLIEAAAAAGKLRVFPGRYSAALCRGLIEAMPQGCTTNLSLKYSAALCRGLIEARYSSRSAISVQRSIPRLYAAASLKQCITTVDRRHVGAYSAALCRGLIEAGADFGWRQASAAGIPRLYAAASLKPHQGGRRSAGCRGIPRLYAAASLKQLKDGQGIIPGGPVFRGFMPRPH